MVESNLINPKWGSKNNSSQGKTYSKFNSYTHH